MRINTFRGGLLVVLASIIALTCGCMRVAYLGDNTGKAFHATLAAQERPGGDDDQTPMEAELGSRAAAKMIAGDAGQSPSTARPQLSLPVVSVGP